MLDMNVLICHASSNVKCPFSILATIPLVESEPISNAQQHVFVGTG